DIETKCYVVNTNASYMNEAWKDMVGDGSVGKAAAYYGRKNAVQRIEKDAIVYLYHTGQGIIAKGSATAGYQSVSYNGDPGEEFNVPLKLEWALKDQNEWHKAPKAWQINQSVGASHRFRRTVFEISEEMAKEIDRIHKENEELLNDSAQAVE
ncbi:MAG: hypothetical protein U9Q07_09885, partial [Planctomycetota bacterium]|nr:hypothetical protein [Planctomycetota bacterium]